MKGEHSNQEQTKHSTEDWVSIARKFGEECVKIQHDSKLNIDQKLEQQKALGTKMAKEIAANSHLSAEDKSQMTESIESYIREWKLMHDMMEQENKEKVATKK